MEIDISPHNQELYTILTPENLRGFSVREISRLFGSEGLDLAIDIELNSLGLAEDTGIQFARQLAYRLHKDDRRSDESSGNDHLRRTSLRLMREMGITDPEVIAAQMLHDSVEDHAEEIIDLLGTSSLPRTGDLHHDALQVLGQVLPERCVTTIATLTYPKFPKGPERLVAYATQTHHTLRCPVSQPGKLSDFIDNAAENHYTLKDSLRIRLDAKQLGCYRAHIAALNTKDCLIPEPHRPALIRQLQEGWQAAKDRLVVAYHSQQLDTDMWYALVDLNPELAEMVH